MKILNALFVLRVAAPVMTMPIEPADGDIVMIPCSWNGKCFITCSDTSGSVAELTEGICPGICGIDWTIGVMWAEDIDIDGFDIGFTLASETTAESFVRRELDVGAHADWKDTLDMGAHVDWSNKDDTKAEV